MPADRLQPADVELVYRELLGRAPAAGEIDHQLASLTTVRELLRIVVASEEYAERAAREAASAPRDSDHIVNIHHPDLARWAHPPGTRSADGVAVAGREGWLFLREGTNANLGQFLGEVQMEPEWLDGWRRLVERRREEADALGAAMAFFVVPDKLAVHGEHYPDELVARGPRPVERLLEEAGLPISYPLEACRAAAQHGMSVFERTDSHLSLKGNRLLHEALCGALGERSPAPHGELPSVEYAWSGDLGRRFDPQIVEVVRRVEGLLAARMIDDNREQVAAVGGHIGTRRVFANDSAPDGRVAVVFGDSYAFAAPKYQGMSWFLAQKHREVHFVWVPFGWDPGYARRVDAEVVVFQAAERFVARLPRDVVDVDRLAEETLRRKAALGLETVFGA